ncbi:MAG: tetratricopeptide repeat protein [Bacteroidales bacterium]|nr:tetratricopeptide repeat protein [Bacteroidales bacterium]
MAPNPYDTCPCGSGKKFKFCCEKYFDKIDRAMNLSKAGQHETALRVMEALTQELPQYAPIWGYYAELLYSEGQVEKADEAIEKGFAIDKNFAMGYFLRGVFRYSEGEIIGALLLFRKAVEVYGDGAVDQLVHTYDIISQLEHRLGHPVASRAALERIVHLLPHAREATENLENVFGVQSLLPEAARKPYRLRSTVQPLSAETVTGRFSEVRKIYDDMVVAVPDDPAAWFNLGLVRAWLGEQSSAIDALLRSIELEWDDAKAEEASALVEVLRCGVGMENDSDYISHRAFLQIRDTDAMLNVLKFWDQDHRLRGVRVDEQNGLMVATMVETIPTLIETGNQFAKFVANLVIGNGFVRIWGADADKVARVGQEIRDRAGLGVSEVSMSTGACSLMEILQPALIFPSASTNPQEAKAKLQDSFRNYLEEVWAHRSLRSLNGATPIDAMGSKNLRKRVLGIIKFLSDCMIALKPNGPASEAESADSAMYDFHRLRHKLGAEVQPPGEAPTIKVAAAGATSDASPTVTPASTSAKPTTKRDFGAMNVAELAAVDPTTLTVAELDEAMRASVKLDARELAVRFAAAGVDKPADPAKPDRYTLYACLITGAISNGDWNAALAAAEAGQKYDTEHNEARRTNEFSLQKAKLFGKRGDITAAVSEFESLIARNPDEGKYYIAATEAMLSVRNGSQALRFAEQGLAKARSSNNRDLEGACLELSEAARRSAP